MRPTTFTRAAVMGAATLALLAPAVAVTGPAGADGDRRAPAPPKELTLASNLVSPLSVAVAHDGTRYVSQNFAGLLVRQRPGQKAQVIYESGGPEVGAVSVSGKVLTFALTGRKRTWVRQMAGDGPARTIAVLSTFERRTNPDGRQGYGFASIGPSCAAQLPDGVPAQYQGIKESHPYASTTHDGTTYVADAAANAIFAIAPDGAVSTLAVLPAVRVKISAAAAEANGLPACAVGRTYRFEAVPTDIEVGPDDGLYVTLLPGGPEDGSTGAQGRVVRVGARSGDVRTVARGLVSATGLAVAANGNMFVSELFGGRISKIPAGSRKPQPFLATGLPGDVELRRGQLYATVGVLAEGRLVRIRR